MNHQLELSTSDLETASAERAPTGAETWWPGWIAAIDNALGLVAVDQLSRTEARRVVMTVGPSGLCCRSDKPDGRSAIAFTDPEQLGPIVLTAFRDEPVGEPLSADEIDLTFAELAADGIAGCDRAVKVSSAYDGTAREASFLHSPNGWWHVEGVPENSETPVTFRPIGPEEILP